nr:uncharacterized protein LOC124812497 [Hydra vulgaris]
MCRKYILILPDISVHRNHPVGNEAGLSQPLSKSIINEIAELVRKGVNSVPDMRRHLDAFVQMKFVSNNILKTNKRFYPRDETIANHIEKARKNFQRSLIDQECLLGKIDEWKVYFPEACIYFRPKVEKSDNSYPALKNSLLFVYQDVWQYTSMMLGFTWTLT